MTDPTFVRHIPHPPLRPFVSAITGYAEHGRAAPGQRESASLDIPVVIAFSGAFRIAFDRPPAPTERYTSFAAGLHPGFVAIDSGGDAACLQIDFTPLGARLALGQPLRLPMHALASRMVPLDDLGDPGLAALADRLAALPGWPARIALAEAWAARRVSAGAEALSPDARATAAAYRALRRSGGTLRIGALAARLGWSRKRLVARFRDEIGVPPKTLARILRFMEAERRAAAGPGPDWADIAAACGYADQAHLSREFRVFAGSPPAAWAAGSA